MQLGIQFEEGRGVVRDLKTRRKFYAQVAADDLLDIDVYQPKIGGIPAQTLKIKAGSFDNGILEAKLRMKKLEDRKE